MNATNLEGQDRSAEDALLRRFLLHDNQSSSLESGGQKGTSTETGSRVIVRRVVNSDHQKIEDAHREIFLLKSASDSSIPAMVEWLETDYWLWLVIEDRPGRSVRQVVQNQGSLPDDVMKSVTTQLMSGIVSLFSAGFAHLRICDETLFLDDEFQLLIKDFRFACEYGTEITDDGYAMVEEKYGNDIYTAPEIFANRSYNARKAVIWSCGVALYYMVTGQTDRLRNLDHPSFENPTNNAQPVGRRSFSRRSSRKLSNASQQALHIVPFPNRLSVPSYLRDVISKMLMPEPTKRAELIEVVAKVPKEAISHSTRPLMEHAWLDYKHHVGPMAGLDWTPELDSSASSIFSSTSAFSDSLGALLGGGRRRSSSRAYNIW